MSSPSEDRPKGADPARSPYRNQKGLIMGQSRRMSLVESWANVVVGYVVALGSQVVVFPVFGVQASLEQNVGIGLVFTVVSVVRSYLLRRWFNRRGGGTLGGKSLRGGGRG